MTTLTVRKTPPANLYNQNTDSQNNSAALAKIAGEKILSIETTATDTRSISITRGTIDKIIKKAVNRINRTWPIQKQLAELHLIITRDMGIRLKGNTILISEGLGAQPQQLDCDTLSLIYYITGKIFGWDVQLVSIVGRHSLISVKGGTLFYETTANSFLSYNQLKESYPSNKIIMLNSENNTLGLVYFYTGWELKQQDNIEKAITALNKSVALWPEYPLSYYTLGNIHFSQSDYQKAIEYYDKTLDLYPDYINALFRRAQCRKFLQKFDQAFSDISRVVDLLPQDFDRKLLNDIYFEAYDISLELGKYREAEMYHKLIR